MSKKLVELKRKMGEALVSPQKVNPQPGLPTGHSQLDNYLLWSGLPLGDLSLFSGSPGGGVTSLWAQTALKLTQQGRWVAWVNSAKLPLCPWSLQQDGCDFSKLVTVSAPSSQKQLLWALQELMSLSLFDLIGCDLGESFIRNSQLIQLKRMARRYQTSLVLLSSHRHIHNSPFYSLILRFEKSQIRVERALHRPTPSFFQRRNIYADLMPGFAEKRKALCS